MVFFQYFFGFYRFSSSLISLFFIDQSVSIIDIGLCIVEPCYHCWKRLICFPMLPRWLGILSIPSNIGSLFLFSDIWGLFQFHRLLHLPITQVMVLGNCFHRLRSQCMVKVVLHGIHCGFSMIPVVSVDKLLVQVLHQFQMVLLVLVQSSCDGLSLSFSCPAIPSGSFWMEWILIVSN
jgi:hypothetical protein